MATRPLYDLGAGPRENDNLLARPGHEDLAERMNAQLFRILEGSDGMPIQSSPDAGERNDRRDPQGRRRRAVAEAFLRPAADFASNDGLRNPSSP